MFIKEEEPICLKVFSESDQKKEGIASFKKLNCVSKL